MRVGKGVNDSHEQLPKLIATKMVIQTYFGLSRPPDRPGSRATH